MANTSKFKVICLATLWFLASIAFLVFMSAQEPERAYFDKLNQFVGNKVLLLGIGLPGSGRRGMAC